MDLNPNSSKVCSDDGFESPSKRFESRWRKSEVEGQRFESLSEGFDSLHKEQVKRVKLDSNPLHNDSNP